MEAHSQKFKIRLGLFVAGGLALFVLTVFIIGKQKNLFDPVFRISTQFYNVSGLQVGNNIRFSGISVGTVDNITIINDSTVQVDMLIKKSVQQFIKSDSEAGIGSEGLIGDKLVVITQGSADAPMIAEGQMIKSSEPVETDAIMASLAVTAGNAEIISEEIAALMININGGKGTIGRLIYDSTIAEDLSKTMVNLKKSTKGLDENMEAAQHNFLLKGFFKKKQKEAEKKKKEAEELQKQKDKDNTKLQKQTDKENKKTNK